MGNCASRTGMDDGSCDDGNDNDEWMYVEAIRKPQYLDWRQFVTDPSEAQNVKEIQRNPPVPIMDDVYLGGATSILDFSRLQSLGITHILNVAGKEADSDPTGAMFVTRIITAADRKGYKMLENHLEECRSFIQECREQGGKCVVHCQAGANRSGVIVAAEKMLTSRLNVLEVVAHCRKMRGPTFLCNFSFIEELVQLAKSHDLLGPRPGQKGCIVQTKISRPAEN